MSLALVLAGIPIDHPPFVVGDLVVWNEKMLKPDRLNRYIREWGIGPFVVAKTSITKSNASGSIQVRSGRKYLYMVRPKNLKPGIPITSARWWDLHDFRKH